MYNRNPYFYQYLKQTVEPDETYYYYFYVMSYAPLTKYLLYQSVTPFFNKHIIVCVTNKRILVCEMNPMNGKLTGNTVEIDGNVRLIEIVNKSTRSSGVRGVVEMG
ncbi:hypothetical protein [Paenibacillus sp. FSL H8-0537]|uniref:hypothetical protein n=1 Tax=Paenibacillus sp. FSL H8-0537 TaxID=2921399 RepID=UPI003100FAC1